MGFPVISPRFSQHFVSLQGKTVVTWLAPEARRWRRQGLCMGGTPKNLDGLEWDRYRDLVGLSGKYEGCKKYSLGPSQKSWMLFGKIHRKKWMMTGVAPFEESSPGPVTSDSEHSWHFDHK